MCFCHSVVFVERSNLYTSIACHVLNTSCWRMSALENFSKIIFGFVSENGGVSFLVNWLSNEQKYTLEHWQLQSNTHKNPFKVFRLLDWPCSMSKTLFLVCFTLQFVPIWLNMYLFVEDVLSQSLVKKNIFTKYLRTKLFSKPARWMNSVSMKTMQSK